jgi:hypothetical protein
MAVDSTEVRAQIEQFIGLVDKYVARSHDVAHWTQFVDAQRKQGLTPNLIVDGKRNQCKRELKDAAAEVMTAGQDLASLLTSRELDFSGVLRIRGAVGAYKPQTVEEIWDAEKARLRTIVETEG